METRTVTDSGVQVALADESLEGTTAKRMKKEPRITGKSVVVLRGRDVVVRSGIAFMPNTIEMAQLKKPEKGQFKTNVQFCPKMTEVDVKMLLMDTFPYLENQRFYCAAAADNRTRLDFHGQPRIWDGQFIKRKIKGNSALYVLTYEQENDDGLDSKVPELMTLKRSHDQITSPENEMSEQSLKIGTKSANTLNVLTGFKAAVHGSSILTGASAEESTALEKSEKSHQKLPEKMSQMVPCIYVPVTGQHGMSSVLCPSISATHDTKIGKDLMVSLASLSQSLPLVMVPDSAVQSGAIPKARISTASDQQSLSKTADGSSNTRQAGLPLAVHKTPQVIYSMLTSGVDKLHISGQSPGQLQETIKMEKTVLTRDQSAQTTEGRGSSEVGLPVTTTAQGVELVKEAGTGFQQGARSVLSDLLGQSTDDKGESGFSEAEEKGVSRNSAAEGPPHKDIPLGVSVSEAGLADSGIETSEDIGGVLKSEDTYLDVERGVQRIGKTVEGWQEFVLTANDQANPLNLLSFAVEKAEEMRSEATEKKSIVEVICPSAGPIQGGTRFLIVFSEPLRPDVESGFAVFGYTCLVTLTRLNAVNMTGCVPAASAPGTVDVRVYTSRNEYLGVTHFTYVDEEREVLDRFLHNQSLWPTFFSTLADKMRRSGAREDKQKETFNFPGFKDTNTESPKPSDIKAFYECLLWLSRQVLGRSDRYQDTESPKPSDIKAFYECLLWLSRQVLGESDRYQENTEDRSSDTADDEASDSSEENTEDGSVYTADDEASDSSEDGDSTADDEASDSSEDGDSTADDEASDSSEDPLTSQDPTSETSNQSSDGPVEASHSAQAINFMADVSIRDLENFHTHTHGVEETAVDMSSDPNPTDTDENSEADKSRRASRRGMNDFPSAEL